MSNSFLRRVDAERTILSVVNRTTSEERQLTGLSSNAIDSWCRHMKGSHVEEMRACLLRVGRLCQCLSDRSHESFGALDPRCLQGIDLEKRKLCELLGLPQDQ